MCGPNGAHDHDPRACDHAAVRELDGALTFGKGLRLAGTGGPLRVGIGGPVGSGKTALVEQLVPRLLKPGIETVVVTNDIVTTEDAEHVRRTLAGILDA